MLKINHYNSEILHDITFSLNNNENLIILGENGAGKSTLAKVLCNLINSNKVLLNDENISTIPPDKRASYINYIPPKLSIFDEYITLREFLELSFITLLDSKKVDWVISLLQLQKLENRHCNTLSSGEKQLLLLASSIIHNAQITIFDELTANLDINRLKEVYDIFQSNILRQKIIITHNLDLAYTLGYKILFLQQGKIKFFTQSSDFFTNDNLDSLYNNTIKKINNHLVLNL